MSYQIELFPDGAPFSQCGGHLLHQGHLNRGYDLLISTEEDGWDLDGWDLDEWVDLINIWIWMDGKTE